MNNRQNKYLQLAIKLASKTNNGSTFFFGGVLFKKGKIISIGFNQPYKTHPQSNNKWKNIHCELHTILNVSAADLFGSSLFVVRLAFNKTKMAIAKPCKYCQAIIKSCNIFRVYYSISEKEIGLWDVRKNTYSNEIL